MAKTENTATGTTMGDQVVEAQVVEVVEATVQNEDVTADANSATAVTQALSEMASKVPTKRSDILPLDYQKAFNALSEAEQQQIMSVSDSIDVRQLDKVMSFGSQPLKETFEQCGEYLKSESGSAADQAVIAQVIEISKKASESYEDFNLVLKEPGFLQKLWLKFFSKKDSDPTEKVQNSAVTTYKLLSELQKSYDSWMRMLEETIGEISAATESDMKKGELIEKYIMAGQFARERIEGELESLHTQYQETGLMKFSYEYDEMKRGRDLFNITLANLEKSRIANAISRGQLSLILEGNIAVQSSIKTDVDNSMALLGQQLRNAVFNAKSTEVMKAKKAINRLNDELIKEVSKSVGMTTEEAEKLMYSGFYSIEAAKEAVSTIIDACNSVKNIATEMLPKMQSDVTEINALLKELEPAVNSVANVGKKTTSSTSTTPSANASGELKF